MTTTTEQSPGHAAPRPARDLKSIREERRLVRAEIELNKLEQEKRLSESAVVYGDGINGLLDMFSRFHDVNGDWFPLVGSRQDKQRGQNFPFYRTEMELNLLRQPSRLLYGTNMYAKGIINGLQSYVVGDGFTYQAEEQFQGSANKQELAAIQQILDEFCEQNMMPEFEEEAVMRGERDGEGLARVFWPDDYDTAELRVVEPELIIKPPGTSDEEWSFGIRNPVNPVDTQKALGYWVAPMEVREDGEYVEASEMMHFKRNCERTVKRGCPSFVFGTYESLDGAGRLKRNVTEGAAIQAAVAEIVQYENATKSEIQNLMAEKTDYTRISPMNPTASRDVNFQKVQPGTRRNIPKGMTYVQPPGSVSIPGHVEALQASLRAAGIVWNAPEWLSSGLHDTSSFASSLTAESPFVKGIKRMQGFYGRRFVMLLKLVIQMAELMGRLRPGILKRIKIKAKGPSIEVRDKLKEAQGDQVCLGMKTKSPQQICQEQGNDYEETCQQIEEHEERFGPIGGALGMPQDGAMPGEGGQGQRPAPFKRAQESLKTVAEAFDGKDQWITVNGAHVFIDKEGNITKGPEHLKGQVVKRDVKKSGGAIVDSGWKLQKAGKAKEPAAKSEAKPAASGSHAEQKETLTQIANAHIDEKSVGPAFDTLYAKAKDKHPGMTKEDFRSHMNELHSEGSFKLGGWPRMHDDLPDPELAVHVGGEKTRGPRDVVDRSKAPDLDKVGKLMYYLQPASGVVKQARESLDGDGSVLLDVPDIRQSQAWDCGAAALRAVCAYFGVGGTEAEFALALGTTESEGTNSDAIARVAESLNMAADKLHNLDVPALQRMLANGTLIICPIQAGPADGSSSGHYVVVCGYNPSDDSLTLQDPVHGRVQIAASDFVDRWHDKGADGKDYIRFGVGIWK